MGSNHFKTINFIKSIYPKKKSIYLHEPVFRGNERKYLLNAIDSTFVSSSGSYVDRLEIEMASVTNTKRSIATVNGTSALQVSLKIAGVKAGDEVLTQALSFVATANAILYNGASPVFLDVDLSTMGLSPDSVSDFLDEFGEIRNGVCFNKKTNKKISACLPMHTFGFPVNLSKLIKICDLWKIPIIEDAAEALGSEYNGKSVGSFGELGVFSFNGNKIITSGGGGIIVTNNIKIAKKAKHLTTTAKVTHPYEFIHDELGYNFRMPNLNAALACAQMEQLSSYVKKKRKIAKQYSDFFKNNGIKFREELPKTKANYWLMCIELDNKIDRDMFLKKSNLNNIMTRPIWQLIYKFPYYSTFQRDCQKNAIYLEERIVNLPSGII